MSASGRRCTRCLRELAKHRTVLRKPAQRAYATVQAVTPAPNDSNIHASSPISRFPQSQPPSHKPAEFRRTQLHRQYTSLLRSTPLMVLFQHNNLTALEWAGIRRELNAALRKTDQEQIASGSGASLADHTKLQVIKTGIFGAALRVVEYFEPEQESVIDSQDPRLASSMPIATSTAHPGDSGHRHSLSRTAYKNVLDKRFAHPLVPLLNGPIAILTFPSVSTEHLKTALSILSPSQPNFPAPTRRASPGYYELPVQSGLPKLMLLGARIEGSVFDNEKTKWVGTITGGIDGLRAQLVATLGRAGVAITTSLEAASRNVYLTLASRRTMLEEDKESGTGAKKDEQ